MSVSSLPGVHEGRGRGVLRHDGRELLQLAESGADGVGQRRPEPDRVLAGREHLLQHHQGRGGRQRVAGVVRAGLRQEAGQVANARRHHHQ